MIRPEPGELQELVQDLHRQGTAWLPAGLGSRLDWGAPVAPCTVVSCGALRGIREHNPGDFTVTVAAGTPLEELQEELGRHRQWLAVDPPFQVGSPGERSSASGLGSVGGLVARGLAGGYRERYLGVRDQLIGIALMRADGVCARAGGRVVKNVAGYDLMRLLTGSWGSLALITEVTLRTMPLPPRRRGVVLSGPLQALAEEAQRLLRSGLTPERIDLWSASLAAAAGLERRPHLLVGLMAAGEASLEEQQAALTCGEPLSSHPCSDEAWRELLATARRAGAPEAVQEGEAASPPQDQAAWLLRLGVAPSSSGALLALPELAEAAVDVGPGSGLGLAWAPAGGLDAARVGRLRQHCRAMGGHLMVLRQPGAAGGGALLPAWEAAPSAPWIEAVKRRFDPKLQLAPGRLPGVVSPAPAQPPARGRGA